MLRRVRDGRDLAGGLYRAPRNAGPQTRAMYEYQDKCVALRCIPNLLPGSPVEAVAVEWSTDYVLSAVPGSGNSFRSSTVIQVSMTGLWVS